MCVQVTDTTQAPREASGRLFRLPRSPVPLVSAVRRPPTASPQAGAVRGLRKAMRHHWRLLFGTSSFPGSARGTGESRAMLLLHGRENRVSVKRAALLDGRAGHFLRSRPLGRHSGPRVTSSPSARQKHTGHQRATDEAQDSLEGRSVLPPGRPEGLAWGPGAESVSSPHPRVRGWPPKHSPSQDSLWKPRA